MYLYVQVYEMTLKYIKVMSPKILHFIIYLVQMSTYFISFLWV